MAHYLALSGGIGGAKLVLGLCQILAPDQLTIAVNTGDDFECYGLPICPDIDTTLYTLANLNDTDKGWGRRDESWAFHQTLESLGANPWFQLGDRDLALHVARKQLLEQGLNLTQATKQLGETMGVEHRVVPMSNQSVSTQVHTSKEVLAFQDYFVRQRAEPEVKAISFQGSANAHLSKPVLQALENPELAGVIVCPSNPYLSVDPMLSIPGLVQKLNGLNVPIIAVSPIVGGKAIKGPTAKIMSELGLPCSAVSVVQHYQPWLNGLVMDNTDTHLTSEINSLDVTTSTTQTIMRNLDDKTVLAEHCLQFIRQIT